MPALASPTIDAVVVVAPPGSEDALRGMFAEVSGSVIVVTGGSTRQRSVAAGLDAVGDHVEVVAVHDAARPFASPALFTSVVRAVQAGADAAVPVVSLVDTVKRVRDGSIVGTEPRDGLALAQTPQACRLDLLRAAIAERRGVEPGLHRRRGPDGVGGGVRPHRRRASRGTSRSPPRRIWRAPTSWRGPDVSDRSRRARVRRSPHGRLARAVARRRAVRGRDRPRRPLRRRRRLSRRRRRAAGCGRARRHRAALPRHGSRRGRDQRGRAPAGRSWRWCATTPGSLRPRAT